MAWILVRADSDPSRTARWTDGYTVTTPDPGRLRAMHWARQAITAAGVRSQATSSDDFATWTAAVEAAWWVAALDDLLDEIVGKTAYRAARAADDCGPGGAGTEVAAAPAHPRDHGDRHRRAQEAVLPAAGASYVLYISPSNRWLPATALKPPENDQNLSLREDYDAVVAGLPLSQATDRGCGVARPHHVRLRVPYIRRT